jgi:hypothetical protein
MNFLAHYYFHKDNNNNYFTVGLTMPDLLSFHSRKIRLTKQVLKKLFSKEINQNIRSHIIGMSIHLDLDSWFHSSKFFKKNLIFLQNKYIDFNKEKEQLPHFYSHIILEIFIDRYLLTIHPDIADNFYLSYKKFDFSKVSKIFNELEYFDNSKFLSFANDVANSTFLKEYTDDYSIMSVLKRVSKRIGMPMILKADQDQFASFVKTSYNELQAEIKKFIAYVKDTLKFNSDKIIKKQFSNSI